MVELVEKRLCHAFVWFFPNLPEELLVFNKSVDMILSSMFTCGNLKNKRYTEQGLLGVTVRHHLKTERKMTSGNYETAQSVQKYCSDNQLICLFLLKE